MRDEIPFYTEIVGMYEALSTIGGWEFIILALLSLALQISIVASSILLILRVGGKSTRVITYLQIPFRLIYYVPSVSLVLIGLNYFEDYSVVVAYSLLFLSEVVKAYTMQKWRQSK